MAGFNLIAVSEGEGLAVHWDGALRSTRFGAGAHVISTNHDLDDDAMPEKSVFDAWRAGVREPDVRSLESFVASHEGPRPVCKHGDAFGTVSSSIYLERDGRRTLLHADGPPCRTPFEDVSALL